MQKIGIENIESCITFPIIKVSYSMGRNFVDMTYVYVFLLRDARKFSNIFIQLKRFLTPNLVSAVPPIKITVRYLYG